MNPLVYLLISLELTSLVLAAIFFIAWHSFGRRRYALLWSAAFLFAAVQWVLNLAIQSLPVPVYWVSTSIASVFTLSLSLAAFRLRAGLTNKLQWYVAAGIAVVAAIAWFTIYQRHVGLRTAIGPLYATLIMVGCIHAISYRQQIQPAEWGMIAMAGIFGLCEAAAAFAILSGGAAGDPSSLELYRQINFLSLPAAYAGMGLFTVLILASDMSKEMKALALTDSLTGVLNVRGFAEAAGRLLSASRRSRSPLSAVACDIDHFKSINDRFGHAAGDEALRHFAQHLLGSVRMHDVVGRTGGEEFVLLLAGTTLECAVEKAERLRASISTLATDHGTNRIQIEASFGVAAIAGQEDDIAQLIQRADTALYHSKRDGRNRVTF